MAEYRFVTRWEIDALIQPVWDAIYDANGWPTWWRGVLRVDELSPGDERGVGSVHRTTWKSALPYTLEFEGRTVRVEAPRLLEVSVVGELVGTGLWQLSPRDATTIVQYDWSVRTTSRRSRRRVRAGVCESTMAASTTRRLVSAVRYPLLSKRKCSISKRQLQVRL